MVSTNASPNERHYVAKNGAKYLSTRLLTHNGATIAFALGKSSDNTGSLFFDYSILNAASQEPKNKQEKPADVAEKLDSQSWFDNAKSLRFPSEIRVVGEEAVPVYQVLL
jgi:hypothetical protein